MLREAPLSLPERSLLITAPFVREAVFACARRTAFERPEFFEAGWAGSPLRALRVVRDSMPQIVRKLDRMAQQGDAAGKHAVSSWILHRALLRAAEVWIPGVDQSLPQRLLHELPQPDDQDTPAGETLTRQRLARLARCVHTDPMRLQRPDGSGQLEYAPTVPLRELLHGKPVEIREQVVGALLCVAGWLAVDVRTLGQVLVDHIGLSEHLCLEPILVVKVLTRLICRPKGGTFAWSGQSPHAAIDKALKDHGLQFRNEVLETLHCLISEGDAELGVLKGLPQLISVADLTAERVTVDAGHGPQAIPAFDAGSHVTFRLAQSEVRELLMGERLYGDPTLAIRELYQNALDACRYREARLMYLDRVRLGQVSNLSEPQDDTFATYPTYNDWFENSARITFTQFADENGREYIRCEDTGIGMDRRTLENCFAQAGRRFADTTEFLEEQARWLSLDPPIEFYPNSQFGIGVFSYFMLADELRIQTRRLGPDGHPELKLLDVRVSGSGSLFHIRDIEDPHRQLEPRDAGTIVTLHLSKTEHTDGEGKTHRISAHDTLRELLWLAEYPTKVSEHNQQHQWQPNQLNLPSRMSGVKFSMGATPECWWLNQKDSRILSDGVVTDQESSFVVINLRRGYRPELTTDRRRIRDMDHNHARSLQNASLPVLAEPPSWADFEWFWSFGEARPELTPPVLKLMRHEETYLPLALLSETWMVHVATVGCVCDREIPHWMATGKDRPDIPLSILAVRVGLWKQAQATEQHDLRGSFATDSLANFRGWSGSLAADLTTLSRDLDGESPWLEGRVPGIHLLAAAAKLQASPRAVLLRLSRWVELCELELPSVDFERLDDQPLGPADLTILSWNLNGIDPWL